MYFSRVKKSKAFAEDNDNRRLAPLPKVSWLYYLGKKELYGPMGCKKATCSFSTTSPIETGIWQDNMGEGCCGS